MSIFDLFLFRCNIENGNTIHVIERRNLERSDSSHSQQSFNSNYSYSNTDSVYNARNYISPTALFEYETGNFFVSLILKAAGGRRPAEDSFDSTVPPLGTAYEQIRQNILTISTITSSIKDDKIKKLYGDVYKSAVPIFCNNIPNNNKYPIFYKGQWIDCRDTANHWLEATVINISYDSILVHYNGWPDQWDEWIKKVYLILFQNSSRIAPFKTKTLHTFLSAHHSPNPVCYANDSPPTGVDSLEKICETLPLTVNQLLPALERLSKLCKDRENNINNSNELNQLCETLMPIMDRVGRVLLDVAPLLSSFSEPSNRILIYIYSKYSKKIIQTTICFINI